MSDSLLLLLTVGFAFVLAELARQAGIKHTSWSATIFVALGFACGPQAFDIFTIETLARFDLLISLLIGVVGFVLGIEFRHATRARAFVAGSLISCLSLFLLSAFLFIMLFAFVLPGEYVLESKLLYFLSLPGFMGVEGLEIFEITYLDGICYWSHFHLSLNAF